MMAGGKITSKKVNIYGIRRLGGKQYVYIGSTVENPENRLRRHIRDANRKRHNNKRLQQIINESDNMLVVDILEEVSENSRYAREYYWIRHYYKDKKHPLTNRRNPIHPRQTLPFLRRRRKRKRRNKSTYAPSLLSN